MELEGEGPRFCAGFYPTGRAAGRAVPRTELTPRLPRTELTPRLTPTPRLPRTKPTPRLPRTELTPRLPRAYPAVACVE